MSHARRAVIAAATVHRVPSAAKPVLSAVIKSNCRKMQQPAKLVTMQRAATLALKVVVVAAAMIAANVRLIARQTPVMKKTAT